MFRGGLGRQGGEEARAGGQVGFGCAEGEGKAGSPGERMVSKIKEGRLRGPVRVGSSGNRGAARGRAEQAPAGPRVTRQRAPSAGDDGSRSCRRFLPGGGAQD